MVPLFGFPRAQDDGDGFAREQAEMACWAAIPQQHQSPWARQLPWSIPCQHGGCGRLPELMRRSKQFGWCVQNTPPTESVRSCPLLRIAALDVPTDASIQLLLSRLSPISAVMDALLI